MPETSTRLSPWHKRIVIFTAAALAISGILWMVLYYALQAAPAFDSAAMRSLLHDVLIAHGVLAYFAAILVGSLLGRHIPAGLKRKDRPLSGILTLIIVAGLIATALLLYYAPSPEFHGIASLIHQALGVLAIAVAWRHIAVWGRAQNK